MASRQIVNHVPKSSNTDNESRSCPSCGGLNPLEAVFCENCGASVTSPLHCPHCGKPVSPVADICEACGTWLLDGHCKFCYAEIEPGSAFCQECGNAQDGIVCPQCGTKNIFDFCSACNTPLTEAARQTLAAIKNDPKVQSFIAANAQAVKATKALADLDIALAKLENETRATPLAEVHHDESPHSSFFSAEFLENISEGNPSQNAAQQRAQQKRQAQDEDLAKRHEKLKQLQELRDQRSQAQHEQTVAADKAAQAAGDLQTQQFGTNQQARCFANAVRPQKNGGWLCNYTGTVHPGPNDCAEPGLGGRWLIVDEP